MTEEHTVTHTQGYLFEDRREEGTPYVFFIEGMANESGEPTESMEVRFSTLAEGVATIANIIDQVGEFDMELGEPEHFERLREETGVDDTMSEKPEWQDPTQMTDEELAITHGKLLYSADLHGFTPDEESYFTLVNDEVDRREGES